MTSTYSTSFRFELPADGDRSGTWGQMLNTFMGTLLEDAITGVSAVSMTLNSNYTLVTASGATDECRRLVLNVTSTVNLTLTRDIIAPAQKKQYIVYNGTSGGQSIQIIGTSGTGVTIPNGKKRWVYFDGTNFVDAVTDFPTGTTINNSVVVTEAGVQTLTNKTLTTPTINSPTISVSDAALSIFDNATPAKILQLQLSGMASATGVLTLPAFTANVATMATLDASQTLTNKTITVADNALTIQDNADPTKQAQFQASGIAAGQTRILTIPNSDGTILYTNGSGTSLTGIRLQGKETIWYPATAMIPPATSGAAAGTTDGTNLTYKTLDFGASEIAYMSVAMPKSWSIASTLGLIPYWTASAGSGTAIWTFTAIAISNDDVIDTATGGTQTSTDTLIATGDLHIGPESAGLTPSGTPAAEDLVVIKIVRTGTIANDVKLLGVKIIYTTNASDDT